MENFEKELQKVENDFKTFRVQRYTELPDIDLYMEQVISFVNKNLGIFSQGGEYLITSSMINNYVKYGIIPPPEKKKYKRRHIAYIFVVYFLKQVLTMSEIKKIFRHEIKNNGERESYDYFCNELERALRGCCGANVEEISPKKDDYALKCSAIAIANKLYAQRVIDVQFEPEVVFDIPLEEGKDERKLEKKTEKKRAKAEGKKVDKD